ncbi:integration host factor subunit alpha [Hydrogenophaga sp.]|uniref:integration host factor subunit alpha n=1 Tax=Hydrogenophaga sp. TaxID=1904254 RepID=UPI00286DF35B|nr:integration host factor subunit alpha [Hydrogenophaga sp.]
MSTTNDQLLESVTTCLENIKVRTVTKAELRKLLCRGLGIGPEVASDVVNTFFELITQSLNAGDDVKLAGFGKFMVRTKAARPGRNVRTGESVQIDSRRSVTFMAGPKQKMAMAPQPKVRIKRKKRLPRYAQPVHYCDEVALVNVPPPNPGPLRANMQQHMALIESFL